MLRQIDRDIWVAQQPLRYFGLSVGTRMTAIRLANRELAIISPIAVNDTITSKLDELGTVKHIIAPNLYHYLFAANFKTRYPNATFWAAPGKKKKKPDLAIDVPIVDCQNNLFDEIDYLLFDGFQTLYLNGYTPLNEYVFYHRASRTLILTDTAFYFDDTFVPMTQLIARLMGGYKLLRPSPLEKLATRDKITVKQAVDQVLEWDFDRVIVAHGSVLETGGKQQFRAGYDWFLNT